jgi:hypothetical protein
MSSNWGLALAVLGLIVLIILGYFIQHFGEYISVYRSSKYFLLIFFPLLLIGEIMLWKTVYLDYINQEILLWPQIPTILLIVCYCILFLFFCCLAILFGKQWLVRMKFRWISNWGPYLTLGNDSTTSIRINWYTKKKKKSENFLLKHNSVNQLPTISTREFFPLIHNHIPGLYGVELSTLTSDQTIRYQIPLRKEEYTYLFLPRNENNTPNQELSFILLSDLHAGGDSISILIQTLEKVLKKENFILNLGDTVSDAQGFAHWKTFFSQMQPVLSQIPMVYIAGNHDGYAKRRFKMWRTLLWQPYVNISQSGYFSFDFFHCHFILLDNYIGSGHFSYFSQDQIKWLDQDLVKAQNNLQIEHIILCMHHPPFSTGDVGCNPILGPFCMDRVKKFTKIKMILAGHCHFYQSFLVPIENRIVAFIVAGGGGKMEKDVLKRFSSRIYKWDSSGLTTNPYFFHRGNPNSPLRNDSFIRQYHHRTIITHHFLKVSIIENAINLKVFNWQGNLLDEIKLS